MKLNRLHQSIRPSLSYEPCLDMKILKLLCKAFTVFMGLSSSRPFVSSDGCISLFRLYVLTKMACAFSPSSTIVAFLDMCPFMAPITLFDDGFPFPIGNRIECLPSVAVAMQILSCDRPLSFLPSSSLEVSDGFLLR